MPFLFFADVRVAVRLSNLVAIVMMFGVGYTLARHAGFNPWWTGLGVRGARRCARRDHDRARRVVCGFVPRSRPAPTSFAVESSNR